MVTQLQENLFLPQRYQNSLKAIGKGLDLYKLRDIYHEILKLEARKLCSERCIYHEDSQDSQKEPELCPLLNTGYCVSLNEILEIATKIVGSEGSKYVQILQEQGAIVKVGEDCFRSLHFDLLIRASDTRLHPCASRMISTSRFALRFTPISDPKDRKYMPKNDGIKLERKLMQLLTRLLGDYSNIFISVIGKYFRLRGSKGYDLYQLGALVEALENWDKDVYVITAPTGIGKTEIFLSIMLIKILETLKQGRSPIIYLVYPRKMLEIDQMERILALVDLLNDELIKSGVPYRVRLYLRDGDTIELRKRFETLDEESKIEFRGIKCSIDGNKGQLYVFKRMQRPYIVCLTQSGKSKEYDFVVPFDRLKIDYQNINIVVTNMSTLLYRMVTYTNEDIDVRNVIAMDMLIFDEVHEYEPLLLAYIHYVIKTIKAIKSHNLFPINNPKLKVVLCSATLGNYLEFAKKLTGTDIVVDLSFTYISRKYGIRLSGRRAFIYAFMLMRPNYGWPTYISEYIAIIDMIHYLCKCAKKFMIPQAVIFINNVRELNRTMTVLRNALQLGSPLDNLCLRRYQDLCLNQDPRKTRHILRHYIETLDNAIKDALNRYVKSRGTLYDLLWPLNAIIYSGTPLHERSVLADKLKGLEVACVLATSSLELGVDYPGVSIVINVGFDNEASMIQRFGRGGRDIRTLDTVLAMVLARNNPLDYRQFFEPDKIKSIVSGSLSEERTILVPSDILTLKYLAVLRMALTLNALNRKESATRIVRSLEELRLKLMNLIDLIENNLEIFLDVVNEDCVKMVLRELNRLTNVVIPKLGHVSEELEAYQQTIEFYLEHLETLEEVLDLVSEELSKDSRIQNIKQIVLNLKVKAYEISRRMRELYVSTSMDIDLIKFKDKVYSTLCIDNIDRLNEDIMQQLVPKLKENLEIVLKLLTALNELRELCKTLSPCEQS